MISLMQTFQLLKLFRFYHFSLSFLQIWSFLTVQLLNSNYYMIQLSPSNFTNKITHHYQNMKINNQRILAQFRAELRRYNFSSAQSEKDKYQSTCMETINQRSKEAEGDSFHLFQPKQQQDPQLQQIFQKPKQTNYQTNPLIFDVGALQKRLRKSPGWTISATRQSLTTVDKQPQPQVREFCHIYEQN